MERVNRELVRLMRTLLAEQCLTPVAWPSILLLTQAAIDNTPAEVRPAGQTPSQVMFGSAILEHAPKLATTPQVERGQRRDSARGVKDIDFDIGDFVLVYVTRQRNKLRVKLTGRPFRVVDTFNQQYTSVRTL